MKKTLLTVILASVAGIMLYGGYNHLVEQNTVTVQNASSTPMYEPKPFEKDVVSEAQKEINKALEKLQEEVDKLNEELDEENDRHQSTVEEIQAKLDRITVVKMSFTNTSTLEAN